MSHRTRPLKSLTFTALLLLAALPLFAVSFTVKTQSGQSSRYHADFNGDGREDFVLSTQDGFAVQLSTGSGTYAPAVDYALPDGGPAVDFAIGNFVSSSGDIAAIDGAKNIYVFVNNGNGTFHLGPVIAAPDNVWSIVAADFNHDGHMDIAYGTLNTKQIHVLFGPIVNGAFTAGPVTTVPDSGVGSSGAALFVGDFDGDGKADLMANSCTGKTSCQAHVYYGDGTGHFPTQVAVGGGVPLAQLRVFDVNGDGRSDLIGLPFTEDSVGSFTLFKYIQVFYGNASRTWSETRIATGQCGDGDGINNVSVADFNGDGIPDIAVKELSNCTGDFPSEFPESIKIMTGKGGGAFNPPQTIFQTTNQDQIFGPEPLRSALTTKPDLAFGQCGDSNCQTFDVHSLLNTTSGAFPSCNPPSGIAGIQVCGPAAGSTVASPVSVRVGAVTQTPARKVELWIDGKKVGEQLTHAFSHYAFLNKSVSLASGKHTILIFAAGWDNWVEKKSFTITVN